MKKLFLSVIMIGLCAVSVPAQEAKECEAGARERDFKGFTVSAQGGMLFSKNENTWTYYDDGRSTHTAGQLKANRDKLGYGLKDLFTPQGSITVGYDFSHAFAARLQAGYAKNASAGNHNEISAGGFYPYSFNTLSIFADAVLNISGLCAPQKQHLFETKVYAGLGCGIGLSADTKYVPSDLYKVSLGGAFGFRAGIIEEVYISKHIGAFLDLNLEAYTDRFNGVDPTDSKYDDNFPLDLRSVASLGLVYYF